MPGVGLIGYGGIGRLHALCFRMLPLVYPHLAHVQLVAVAATREATVQRARQELGDVLVTTNLRDLLGHPGIALVDCCAPTETHAQLANAVIASGKAFFCEKPLAATAAESAAIAARARERGIVGGLNYHFRFVPAIQEARRWIADGALGEVTGFHLRYYRASNLKADRPLSWRFVGPGSGVLIDLGSHLIDLVLHLLGPVARVAARTHTAVTERPGPDGSPQSVTSDDVAWLQLTLASGGFGTLEASKLVPGAGDDLRIEAYGSRGSLVFDSTDPNHLQIADTSGMRRIAVFNRATPALSIPGAETPSATLHWHLASLAAFLEAYLNNQRPEPNLDDGVLVDQVITAAFQSVAQGGAPVMLNRTPVEL